MDCFFLLIFTSGNKPVNLFKADFKTLYFQKLKQKNQLFQSQYIK